MTRLHRIFRVAVLGVALAPLPVAISTALASPPHAAAHGDHGEHADAEAHGEHGPGGLTLFNFPSEEDPRTGLVWSLVNFAVLVGVLELVLFRNLRQGHARKRASIQEELDKATRAREEAESIIANFRAKVDRLDEETEAILAEARARASEEHARILEEARAQAEQIKVAAERAAEREAKLRVARIEAEVADQAIAAAEALLRKRFGEAEQRRAVEDYVAEIGAIDLGRAS